MIKTILQTSKLILVIFIHSCTSTTYIVGANFDETYVNKLTPGVTGKNEVIQWFGLPFKKGRINEYVVFIYTFEKNEFPDNEIIEIYVNKEHKSLYVVFDQDNTVKYFTHNIPICVGVNDVLLMKEELKKIEDAESEEKSKF